MIYISFTF